MTHKVMTAAHKVMTAVHEAMTAAALSEAEA